MDKKLIGHKISILRKEKGMTQKELAEKLCVTDKSVSKWETGVHFPDIAVMEDLANELGITVTDLLGLELASSEEVIQGITKVSQEEKNEIKKMMRARAITSVIYGIIGASLAIYFSWLLYSQGLKGGVYGACTCIFMICAMEQAAYGIYSLFNLRRL